MYQPNHLNEAQCLQNLLHAQSFCLANFVVFYLARFVASLPFSYNFFFFFQLFYLTMNQLQQMSKQDHHSLEENLQ